MWWPPLLALLLAAAPPPGAARSPGDKSAARPPGTRPYCSGTYADTFSVLSNRAVELSHRPEASFTHCLRSTATFECLSYGTDGAIRRTRRRATAHGTAFAFKRQGPDTLLLTNQHVTEYVAVTDEDHLVSGVPPGCKRIADALHIVDNERDTFEGDDVPLTRVVVDTALDVAVVKSRAPLPVMPWKVGRSSALRERNVVEVKGFPLGAFQATAQGRVTSVYDHDDFRDWNHDDFVIDAQLSAGNSGSPVLAVNCESGEYELVGIFHADYSRGNALNVVVHVDEVRELMTTLKRSSVARAQDEPLPVAARRRLLEAAQQSGQVSLPFGAVPAEVHGRGEGLVFAVLSRDFPIKGWPVLVLEDLPGAEGSGFGRLEGIWFGNARGLRAHRAQDLAEDDRLLVERSLEALRRAAVAAVQLRAVTVRASTSREAAEDLVRVERELKRLIGQSKDLAQGVADASERLGPSTPDEAISWAEALSRASVTPPHSPAAPSAEEPR